MKKPIYIVGGIIVLLVIVALILPFVIDANRFRPEIERFMSQSLKRKVSIGNLELSLFSGGVAVENLSIADDPAFSNGAFLTADSVTVGVEMWPLIASRALRVTGLTIDQPQATLLRNAAGTWNFSTIGASPAEAKAPSEQPAQQRAANPGPSSNAAQSLAIQSLNIRDGIVSVGNTGSRSKLHKYEQVDLTASNLSYTTQFPFELTAVTPGNGAVAVNGQAGPLHQAGMQQTPLNASLEAKNVDLAATGFTEPGSGIAGVAGFSGTLNSDGTTVTTKGTATASKLQLTPGGSPAGQPVQLAYQTEYRLARQTGVLRQGDVRVGKALAQLTGSYETRGETTSLQMHLQGNNMPAADISSLLPALGITLPPGAMLQQGALDIDLDISGPLDRLVTSGPVNLSDAKVSGFNLGSKMKALATFAGLPSTSDTVIQTLAADLRVSPEGIRAENFNLVVPGIGSMTGSGTISPKQELNFRMTAKLENAAGALGRLGNLGALAGRVQQNGIPFRIQGTTSDPVFVPDVGGIVSGLGGQATSGDKPALPSGKDLGDVLGGIFGRKKQE